MKLQKENFTGFLAIFIVEFIYNGASCIPVWAITIAVILIKCFLLKQNNILSSYQTIYITDALGRFSRFKIYVTDS